MLPPEAIQEFKEIWKTEFKEELSNEKAAEFASRLVNYFKVVYKPIRKGVHEQFTSKKN